MTDACTHLYGVSAWTRDPETGLWVHADPNCMKPSPLVLRKMRRRRVIRETTSPSHPTDRQGNPS